MYEVTNPSEDSSLVTLETSHGTGEELELEFSFQLFDPFKLD